MIEILFLIALFSLMTAHIAAVILPSPFNCQPPQLECSNFITSTTT